MQKTSLLRKEQKDLPFQILIMAIIVLGIVLRAAKYLPAWSMRGDELALTENLLNKSMIELMTTTLASHQAAPIGFLVVEKTLISLFGHSDYILRLPAFLAGCISLFVLWKLLSKATGRYGTLFAISACAIGGYLIYYSAELKQYSSDVLISLIILTVVWEHLDKETNVYDFLKLGLVGTLAICFSHPGIFILFAVGLILVIRYRNNRQKLLWTILTGSIWAAVFLILYFVILRYQTSSEFLVTFWGNLRSFMPMPPWRELGWFPAAWRGLLSIIAGFSRAMTIPLTLIWFLGLSGLWKEQNWQWAAILVLPIAVNMVASGFQKFPFHGRLILYLVPLILIAIAKGIDTLTEKIPNPIAANLVFAGLFILSLSPAVSTTKSYLFTRRYVNDDMKPVLAFIRQNAQKSDRAYLYHYARATYRYYAPSYNLGYISVFYGANNSQKAKLYDDELSALPRGQRIWFVFSFVGETRVTKKVKQDERDYILSYLKEHGMILEEFYSANNASSAHLFILK